MAQVNTSSADATATAAINMLQQLPSADELSDPVRMKLSAALDAALLECEPPMAQFKRYLFSYQTLPVLRLSSDVGIFDAFRDAGYAQMTLDELVPRTKGDAILIRRLLRYLCGLNILFETGQTVYKPRKAAKLYVSGQAHAGSIAHFYTQSSVFCKLLAYYREKGYKTSEDAYDAPFQFAYDTKDHCVEYIAKHPSMQADFNLAMSISNQFRGEPWFEYFPAVAKLGGKPTERPLLVDIGGGTGADACAFRKAHPDLPGRVIVQELPTVVADMEKPLPGGVEAMEYDMFKRQPVPGAAAYYLRTVLHDWPDAQALEALKNVRDAMAPDSLLLLNENLLPERGASLFSAQVDMIMMCSYSSYERTENQWRELLRRGGFRIEHVWRPKGQSPGSNAILEVVLDK